MNSNAFRVFRPLPRLGTLPENSNLNRGASWAQITFDIALISLSEDDLVGSLAYLHELFEDRVLVCQGFIETYADIGTL